jgi:predicted dehydrogenase
VAARGQTPPSEKLNIAGIGIGGMGGSNLNACKAENIVALCDVDEKYASKTFKAFPHAARYTDYRVMLEKQKDIDAVVIATPDHTHAVITMAALGAGKHVYCQKPLTHTVYEARKIAEAAKASNVQTQMGNQGHSSEQIRMVREWIQSGAIGDVKEVHAWTDRPIGDRPWSNFAVQLRREGTADRFSTATRNPELGSVAGPGQVPQIPPRIRSREMAWLAGLWHGVAWRHGLPYLGPGVLGT